MFLPGIAMRKSFTSPALIFSFYVFNEIEAAVLSGEVDAGVIIHENRFTYAQKGLYKITDLGAQWETKTKSPIALGGIVASNRMPKPIMQQVDQLILKIIPYLVGMLVAIRVFRDSGALGYMVDGLSWVIGLTGVDTAFTPALPVAIMKPFSGSGARGLMIDVMKSNGPDSFVGKLASTFQGSADTTFYIIALYFGSVGIKKVRYAIWAGVLADLIGVVAAILIGYVFFS